MKLKPILQLFSSACLHLLILQTLLYFMFFFAFLAERIEFIFVVAKERLHE